jgi:hypothetical protein
MTVVRLEGEFIMSKVVMYAAVAAMLVGPLLAQESKMSLAEGDSMRPGHGSKDAWAW